MQHDVRLETWPFRVPLFIKKRSARYQLLQNNHQNLSRTKYFNKNTDAFNAAPPQDSIVCHQPKVNAVRFEDPYEHINPMDNIHEDTHIIDTQE